MSPRPARQVTEEELRHIFNEGRYYERVLAGELRTEVESIHAADPRSGEPDGTFSEMVWYFDGPERVALVHQYRRPDLSLGASGRPDPKRLLLDSEILFVSSAP